VQMNLAEVELTRGITEDVDALLISCLSVFDRSGFTVGSAYTKGLRGQCAILSGEPERAVELLEDAAAVFGELGAEGYAADMELLLIEAFIALSERQQATALIAKNRDRLTRDVFDNAQAAEQRLDDLAARLG